MKVIVWIDHGRVKVIDVASTEKILRLYARVNAIFTDECVGIAPFEGIFLDEFVKYVKEKAEGWEAFEVFELAEVD